jgi:SagB-type dehydrogenase family enzyme
MGCDIFGLGGFPDDEVARGCRVPDDEWPMLILELRGAAIPVREPDADATVWYGGRPNQLSREMTAYPRIDAIHAATKIDHGVGAPEPGRSGAGDIKLPAPASSTRAFSDVVRKRRSALDFVGGALSISMAQLSAILVATARPFFADFAATRFVQLYLYAHRVDGLEPGVYRFWSERAELELIKAGDQRVAAAGLSLGQDLAGNACVAFSMIAGIDRATRAHGDRGYRYVHFEAGAIGQRLYLAAEAQGLGATGIGAFFDDEVHRYLDLMPEQGQVVYHFAIGYPIPDPRVGL